MNAPVTLEAKPLDTNELEEIADRIRARIRRTVEDIIATGRDLAMVKAKLAHGEFGKWIEREFSMTMRSAQRYIQVAEWAKDKSDTMSLLPPSTLYLLSAKSTPDEIQAEVVSDLKAGKPIEVRRINALIKMARFEQRQAAKAKRRNQRRTNAAFRRHEREMMKHEIMKREMERPKREAWYDQATAEIVSTLQKLDPTDLERLIELVGDDRWIWGKFRQDLVRALTDEDEDSDEDDDPLAIPPAFRRTRS